MKNYKRMDRVNELVKRELGEHIERSIAAELDGLVTITRVQVAQDLRSARVMISFLGSEAERQRLPELLERERAEFQHAISAHTSLKYTPVLHFQLDRSLEKADHVLDILDELSVDEKSE